MGGVSMTGTAGLFDDWAGLTGGRCAHAGAPPAKGNNVVFLALDPVHFAGSDKLTHEATDLAAYVRTSALAPGFDTITLPGDPEHRTFLQRSTTGITYEGTWAVGGHR